MKFILLTLLFFGSQFLIGQETNLYKETMKSFKEYFNAQDVDAVYDLYTPEMQEAMTKNGISRFVVSCFKQFGSLEEISFVERSEEEDVNTYKGKFEKTSFNIEVQLSTNGKISSLQLQSL